MRKKMKAAWFLAALLSAGLAAFPAMAAQGWAQENNTWVYYDSNGNKVYNEWKKGADGQWRYLNGEGYMAVNAWADSDYYVDGQNGMGQAAQGIAQDDDTQFVRIHAQLFEREIFDDGVIFAVA